jgi:hypothetical protein
MLSQQGSYSVRGGGRQWTRISRVYAILKFSAIEIYRKGSHLNNARLYIAFSEENKGHTVVYTR